VIVSRQCAQVVRHRETGWLLEGVSPEALVDALEHALANPGELARWSGAAAVPEECGMESVSRKYKAIAGLLNDPGSAPGARN
jgi:glycosyltransferase involved in cell wall biosynthesis